MDFFGGLGRVLVWREGAMAGVKWSVGWGDASTERVNFAYEVLAREQKRKSKRSEIW